MKDKYLVVIVNRSEKITEDKWKEIDANATANLHFRLRDEILSSIEKPNQTYPKFHLGKTR